MVHADVVDLVGQRVERVRCLDDAGPVRLEGEKGQRLLDKVAKEIRPVVPETWAYRPVEFKFINILVWWRSLRFCVFRRTPAPS